MAAPRFAEMVAASHFSFLEGASHPADMVARALELGLSGIGIADRNSVAGVVRAHQALAQALREAPQPPDFRLAVGARLCFADDTPDIVAYAQHRAGWGRLTRLLSTGNLRAEKGSCHLEARDLLDHAQGLLLIALPTPGRGHMALGPLAEAARGRLWLGATMHRAGADRRRLARRQALARRLGVPLVATADALHARPEDRPLQHVLACIRLGVGLSHAGRRLAPSAERHLKPAAAMARLFADAPEAVGESLAILERARFSLDELRYRYPQEPVPAGWTAQAWLEHLAHEAARARHPGGVPQRLARLLDEELGLIARLNYANYFLTVHDIVAWARAQGILCQGRGSAANSAVCFLLGITSVDPMQHDLLFSRFLSEQRGEPPDIDVDFEHERREEVIQYIYRRYGRHRAGIAATVIHYRPRSAVRDVGKVLGLSDDMIARLSSTVWGSFSREMPEKRFTEAGFDAHAPEIARLRHFVDNILGFPRHLSQHVGGFILTEDRLDETVPILNGAMADRTFIEWDKDDIDALGLLKVDVLALGMLTAIAKSFGLMERHGLGTWTLDSLPHEDAGTYAMLRQGDSIGVFQVESRAQINMLPRMGPREFYDLVIQVAIVRPGPIEGDMVHPYLRRRKGIEAVDLPSPAPPHPPDELARVLGRTLGVPIFQEQAMRLAIVAAQFTPDEANALRRAMATFRHTGGMHAFRHKFVGGMTARGYRPDFAERCWRQIEGFGSYGFPESHAQSFARLVYVSSWIKCQHPAVFCAALLNSQPMGFYAPAQLVRDAREHGVDVRPVDARSSHWDCTLEPLPQGGHALRLGLRLIEGFRRAWAEAIAATRSRVATPEELQRAARLPADAMRLLADADALAGFGLHRRQAVWDARALPPSPLPLFAAMEAAEAAPETDQPLPPMAEAEETVADYQTTRLSLRAHPMNYLRPMFRAERVLSAAEVDAAPDGRWARAAGVVLVRQRPGKGNAIFITLEDETGILNLILWARVFEAQRLAAMAARLMEVEGRIQRSAENVAHLIVSRVRDRTADLDRLVAEGRVPTVLAHADEVARPQLPRGQSRAYLPVASHPRAVRVLPKSRDFH